jgi:hypothetical protein
LQSWRGSWGAFDYCGLNIVELLWHSKVSQEISIFSAAPARKAPAKTSPKTSPSVSPSSLSPPFKHRSHRRCCIRLEAPVPHRLCTRAPLSGCFDPLSQLDHSRSVPAPASRAPDLPSVQLLRRLTSRRIGKLHHHRPQPPSPLMSSLPSARRSPASGSSRPSKPRP